MKRKVFSFWALLLLVGAVFGSIKNISRDSVIISNVEALSQIEEGRPGKGLCWKSVEATENQLILVCNSCLYIQADNLPWSQTGEC